MSILIKGIDMPTNCTRCPCSNDETRYCGAANKYIPMIGKPSFCPLEEAEERKTGKWIDIKLFGISCIKCSECNFTEMDIPEARSKFCQNCGADMRGAGDAV